MKGETILEWQSPEHHFDKKSSDWYWILGIITVGSSFLSFYFGNFLFGIFIIIAGATVGMLSFKETKIVPVKITTVGIIFNRNLLAWSMYRSFWIEEEHVHGSRILMHPKNNYLPIVAITIPEEIDLNELRDLLIEFLDEEPMQESILNKWLDKLLSI